MKKKILLSCSYLLVVIILAAVSASAQTYQVHIPFDFVSGGKDFDKGDYTIRLKNPTSLATIFSLSNDEGQELQSAAATQNRRVSDNGKAFLVFDRYGDDYVMKQMAAPDFGFWTPKTKRTRTSVKITQNSRPDRETVSIVMTAR